MRTRHKAGPPTEAVLDYASTIVTVGIQRRYFKCGRSVDDLVKAIASMKECARDEHAAALDIPIPTR